MHCQTLQMYPAVNRSCNTHDNHPPPIESFLKADCIGHAGCQVSMPAHAYSPPALPCTV